MELTKHFNSDMLELQARVAFEDTGLDQEILERDGKYALLVTYKGEKVIRTDYENLVELNDYVTGWGIGFLFGKYGKKRIASYIGDEKLQELDGGSR